MSFWKKNRRYFLDFVFIFTSVVAAFLFEDYRVRRVDRQNYRGSLEEFNSEIRQINEALSQENGIDREFGWIPWRRDFYQDAWLAAERGDLEDFKVRVFFQSHVPHPTEIIKMPYQYEYILQRYSHIIENQDLKAAIERFRLFMTFRESDMEDLESNYEALRMITDAVDKHKLTAKKYLEEKDQFMPLYRDSLDRQFMTELYSDIRLTEDQQIKLQNLTYNTYRILAKTYVDNLHLHEHVAKLDSLIAVEIDN